MAACTFLITVSICLDIASVTVFGVSMTQTTEDFQTLLQANAEPIGKNAEPVASTSGNAGSGPPEITLDQFKEQLREVEKGLRSLPATAQVCQLGARQAFIA